MNNLKEDALVRVKNSLVIDKIAKEENITVSQADFSAKLSELSRMYQMDAQTLLKQLSQTPGVFNALSQQALEGFDRTARIAKIKESYEEDNDVLHGILQEKLEDESGIELILALDTVYETNLYEDAWCYYISLKRPTELYEKIVVLDAGHGGIDPGTSSAGYVYREKDTNLAVILETKALLDKRNDIKVYYTRIEDFKPSLEQRAGLANAVEADLFISVHCNYNYVKSVHGIEVLYNSLQDGKKPLDSKRLAQLCLEEMSQKLGLTKRKIIDRTKDVYIVGNSNAPVALIELGYMSNATDLKVLISKEAQASAAEGICNVIDKAFQEMEQVE